MLLLTIWQGCVCVCVCVLHIQISLTPSSRECTFLFYIYFGLFCSYSLRLFYKGIKNCITCNSCTMMGEKMQKVPTATDLAKELIIYVSNLRALILILFMAFISIMFFFLFIAWARRECIYIE